MQKGRKPVRPRPLGGTHTVVEMTEISMHFKLPADQASEIITDLCRIGLITEKADGKYDIAQKTQAQLLEGRETQLAMRIQARLLLTEEHDPKYPCHAFAACSMIIAALAELVGVTAEQVLHRLDHNLTTVRRSRHQKGSKLN